MQSVSDPRATDCAQTTAEAACHTHEAARPEDGTAPTPDGRARTTALGDAGRRPCAVCPAFSSPNAVTGRLSEAKCRNVPRRTRVTLSSSLGAVRQAPMDCGRDGGHAKGRNQSRSDRGAPWAAARCHRCRSRRWKHVHSRAGQGQVRRQRRANPAARTIQVSARVIQRGHAKRHGGVTVAQGRVALCEDSADILWGAERPLPPGFWGTLSPTMLSALAVAIKILRGKRHPRPWFEAKLVFKVLKTFRPRRPRTSPMWPQQSTEDSSTQSDRWAQDDKNLTVNTQPQKDTCFFLTLQRAGRGQS